MTIYTDGACLGNPGPGGYGAILIHNSQRKELSGGYRLTTNNRMELMAAIVALEALKEPSEVTLYSDSRYLVEAFKQEWVYKWRSRRWRRGTQEIPNVDLWKRLLDLNEVHRVTYEWVEGHAGHPENERTDRLSVQAAKGKDLPVDEGYEGGRKQLGLF